MKHSITEQLTSRIVNEVLNEAVLPFLAPPAAFGVGLGIGNYLFGGEGPGERNPARSGPMVDSPQQFGDIGMQSDAGGGTPGQAFDTGKPQTPFQDREVIANPGDAGPLPYGPSSRSLKEDLPEPPPGYDRYGSPIQYETEPMGPPHSDEWHSPIHRKVNNPFDRYPYYKFTSPTYQDDDYPPAYDEEGTPIKFGPPRQFPPGMPGI
jgi:hypothetical protein